MGLLPIYRQQQTHDPIIGLEQQTDDPDLCTHDPLPHHLDRALCPFSYRDGPWHDLHDATFEQQIEDAAEPWLSPAMPIWPTSKMYEKHLREKQNFQISVDILFVVRFY